MLFHRYSIFYRISVYFVKRYLKRYFIIKNQKGSNIHIQFICSISSSKSSMIKFYSICNATIKTRRRENCQTSIHYQRKILHWNRKWNLFICIAYYFYWRENYLYFQVTICKSMTQNHLMIIRKPRQSTIHVVMINS